LNGFLIAGNFDVPERATAAVRDFIPRRLTLSFGIVEVIANHTSGCGQLGSAAMSAIRYQQKNGRRAGIAFLLTRRSYNQVAEKGGGARQIAWRAAPGSARLL
jgi:hypothetical protein